MHFETQLLAALSDPAIYQAHRHEIRPFMLGYKAKRALQLGPFMRLQFEDALTLSYQVQEVLRMQGYQSKRAFIEEWDCYRALHPEVGQIKATLMIELDSPSMLKSHLRQLSLAANHLELTAGHARCKAIINSDLIETDERPMGVHFLSFSLSAAFLHMLKVQGEALHIECSHRSFRFTERVPGPASDLVRAEAISRLVQHHSANKPF